MKTLAALSFGFLTVAISISAPILYIYVGLRYGYDFDDLSDIGSATQAITSAASMIGVFALAYTVFYQAKSIRQIQDTIANQNSSLNQQQLTVSIMASESTLKIYRSRLYEMGSSLPSDATAKAQYIQSRIELENKIQDLEIYCENLFCKIREERICTGI